MEVPAIKFYCDYVETLDKNNVHKLYHDTEYGFPLQNDNELFERLVLEINQAGLSWDTILKTTTSRGSSTPYGSTLPYFTIMGRMPR